MQLNLAKPYAFAFNKCFIVIRQFTDYYVFQKI